MMNQMVDIDTKIRSNLDFTSFTLRKSYVLCSSPRCGTYMFAGIMKDLQLGDPYESFNLGANRRYRPYYDVADFFTLVNRVFEKQTSSTGVFGVKLFQDHMDRFIRLANRDETIKSLSLNKKETLDAFFYHPEYLLLLRRNALKQAISLAQAMQSNHFQVIDDVSDTKKQSKTRYDAGLISQTLMRALSEAILWEKFFADFEIQPHRFWFEDLIENRQATIKSVIEFLGETIPIAIPQPRTRKVSTKSNEDWYSRYLEENQWLRPPDIAELLSKGEIGELLAEVAFRQSLKSGKQKNFLVVKMNSLFNKLRWRWGDSFG